MILEFQRKLMVRSMKILQMEHMMEQMVFLRNSAIHRSIHQHILECRYNNLMNQFLVLTNQRNKWVGYLHRHIHLPMILEFQRKLMVRSMKILQMEHMMEQMVLTNKIQTRLGHLHRHIQVPMILEFHRLFQVCMCSMNIQLEQHMMVLAMNNLCRHISMMRLMVLRLG